MVVERFSNCWGGMMSFWDILARYFLGSMYGILTYVCLIFMTNVGTAYKYTVHGGCGYV